MATETRTQLERIEDLGHAKEHAESEYLRRHGWMHTSSTPGYYWLWERKMDDGRTLLVGREFAVQLTRNGIDPAPYTNHGDE